ncbi:porphobilinogen synthase [Pseudoglutamicibacter albus]|uniref:porphobilinogen synthase n=1 Tax=Pseudoglutamicibacter albus TaxID=98671 RepID=UPI000C783545|nr:porphobilinogen synthase [Pseudoglutamicibacter albus]PKY80535.1 porphobilinogen synthase [Pseudoglutamicibacter albus]WIK84555.1 porphobilinogen synthase [Pseudoglutamicibacter albus]
MAFPHHRPRRLRSTAAVRALVRENTLRPADFVLPVFIREGATEPRPITSMPGVVQHSMDSLKRTAHDVVKVGLGGIMLFGVPETKDAVGSAGVDPDGVLNVALREVRKEVGDDTVVMSDLCLDEFTDHGHCGVLSTDGDSPAAVDNDATLAIYADMAVAQAEAGAHMLGPSGMMDGQIGVIREALDEKGYQDTSIFAYTAKYASAFYGPFREAVNSSLEGDRRTYQQDPANLRESLWELEQDIAEGADMVMVKPGLPYLDVLRAVAEASPVPVGAYQVSGEYSMIEAAAAQGWLDRERTMLESLLSFKRAGADTLLTYYALEAAELLASGRAPKEFL